MGNHIVYKLSAKGTLTSSLILSSMPKPPAPKEQDGAAENKVKNHLLPEGKIGPPKVNNNNPPDSQNYNRSLSTRAK
ncbi:hypothetical protein ACUALS_16675 [Vibrio sp. NH-7]